MTKDLMYSDEIQELVVEAYRALDEPGGPGMRFYTPEQLDRLPHGAKAWMLGTGNPVARADLRPGEVVVDLGCGAGADTLLAAADVAPDGRAVGLDILPEMVERARKHAAEAGIDNVELVHGEIESIPLPDASVDVVVSNGVINLSARKSRVLAESYRVLRPGGRFCVSDLTVKEEELPAEILTHPSAWAG